MFINWLRFGPKRINQTVGETMYVCVLKEPIRLSFSGVLVRKTHVPVLPSSYVK